MDTPISNATGDASDLAFDAIMALPVCRFGIAVRDGAIVEARFLAPQGPLIDPVDPLAASAIAQVNAWLEDGRFVFDLPLELSGSDFQRRVWTFMCTLPAGRPVTYGEAAAVLGSNPRAVGGACGRNPVPLIVPCHRIIGRQGGDGFMQSQGEWALGIKRWLLAHEDGVA